MSYCKILCYFCKRSNVNDGVAFGTDASANSKNSVALGRNSIADAQTGSSYLTNIAADADNGVVAMGRVGEERRITNIADGAQDSDAVSVSQLKTLNNNLGGAISNLSNRTADNSTNININSNRIDNLANGRAGLIQRNANTNDIAIAHDLGGNKVKISGVNGDRVLTGVANGIEVNDSANIGQLRTLNNNLNDSIKSLGYKVDEVEEQANAGIAAALSLESAPYIQGKFTYAVGAGFHGGENAIGASLRRTSDNGRWSLNGGVAAASKGGASVRIGVSGVIN